MSTPTDDLRRLLDDASARRAQTLAIEDQHRIQGFQGRAERLVSAAVRQQLGGWTYGVDVQMPRPYSAYAGFTIEAGAPPQPHIFHLYQSDTSGDFRLVRVSPDPRQQAEVHTEDDLLVTLRAWLPPLT